jgi:hypothetical protein
MIFLLNNGPGRFGNHIYNLFYLQTLSKSSGHSIWIRKSNYLNDYFDIKTKGNDSNSYFKRFKILTNRNLTSDLDLKFNYILKPPLLGDHFFYFIDDLDIELKGKYSIGRIKNSFFNVAIHFRGGDFKSWDKNSILDIEYYQRSLDYVLNEHKNIKLFVYTDDPKLYTYINFIDHLKKNKLSYSIGNLDKHFIYDFKEISECDCIISSPSTFCIWASVLGNKKKSIIHSEKWVNYRVNASDKFWHNMRDLGEKYYHNFKII